MSVSILFPFILKSANMRFLEQLETFRRIVDAYSLPAATSELPQLTYVEFGGYSDDDDYYAIVYSPSALGCVLKEGTHQTWEFCAPVLFDHLNEIYINYTRGAKDPSFLPFEKISVDWTDHANNDEIDFKVLYDQWLSNKMHSLISTNIQSTLISQTKKKM